MDKVYTQHAPAAIGPYSQAVVHKNFVFCSGQIALTASGEMKKGSIEEQTHQVIKNLSEILKKAGSGIEKVLKTTVYLQNMEDFPIVNEIYGQYFSHKPARATLEVSRLPKGALIEIEAIAHI